MRRVSRLATLAPCATEGDERSPPLGWGNSVGLTALDKTVMNEEPPTGRLFRRAYGSLLRKRANRRDTYLAFLSVCITPNRFPSVSSQYAK
jgi:hypothetical protein